MNFWIGYVWETVFDVGSLAASLVEVAVNPTDVWAWAGLVGDAVDLAPFITGVGETIKAVDKLSDIDDVVNTAKSLKKTVSKAVGVYEIEYASGINYVGKGPFSNTICNRTYITKYIK